jgi:16S rRNA (uracil1498-N3)-methyltransferase
MQPGDTIIVLDDSGDEWQVTLTEISKTSVKGDIVGQRTSRTEPALHLSLYQGTLKGQMFEWVLQKGTELGVSCFIPTICQRSIVRNRAALAKKQARWQQIIKEAAEQSGRGRLPRLEQAISFGDAIAQAQSADLVVMPWEEATEPGLKEVLVACQARRVALFVGPEGGFAGEEASLAQEADARLVRLGPRILRAETAGIAVCAAVLFEMDEWG